MMLDEIQTGMARTGQWFAFQHYDFSPDVMTLAKALGNGVPIGACLARGDAANLFKPGNHGSTFGGNPLACAAASAVIDTIEKDELVQRAQSLGQYLLDGFKQQLSGVQMVNAIRGKGLMIGIELKKECPELVSQALAQGLLINVTAGKVIRLLPPLILSEAQADKIIEIVSGLIKSITE
jgi:acetylornithine aminotransferase